MVFNLLLALLFIFRDDSYAIVEDLNNKNNILVLHLGGRGFLCL